MAKHHEIGKLGEEYAHAYLVENGLTLLEQNWRHRRAEVDLIAMDGEILVFVEVKTRSSDLWGAPELSVTPRKEALLVDASRAYMEEIDHTWEIRFDIVTVLVHEEKCMEIKHFKDAFFPGLD